MDNLKKKRVISNLLLPLFTFILFISFYFILFNIQEIIIKSDFIKLQEVLLAPSAILTSVIVVLMSININQYNTSRAQELDDAKEQLKYLYAPLNSIIQKKELYLSYLQMQRDSSEDSFKNYAIEYYKYFLELRDIYLENQVYSSWNLYVAFGLIASKHEKNKIKLVEILEEKASENELIEHIALYEMKSGSIFEYLSEDISKKDIPHLIESLWDDNNRSDFEKELSKILAVIAIDLSQIRNDKKPVSFTDYNRKIIYNGKSL